MGDNPELKHGSDDQQWVEYLQGLLQWQLTARGSSTSVPTTGAFDDATLAAVQEFQELAGLMADGVVGDKTWEALLAEPPAAEHEGGGSAVVDFGDFELLLNTYEIEPNKFWIGSTNTGTGVLTAGVVLKAEVGSNTYELRAESDSQPGEYCGFVSENNPEGWQEGDSYTVTAPAEVGGATKSGSLRVQDQGGY